MSAIGTFLPTWPRAAYGRKAPESGRSESAVPRTAGHGEQERGQSAEFWRESLFIGLERAPIADEKDLLEKTIEIVDGLYSSINGAGFTWDESRDIARKNAHSLWAGCTIEMLR